MIFSIIGITGIALITIYFEYKTAKAIKVDTRVLCKVDKLFTYKLK